MIHLHGHQVAALAQQAADAYSTELRRLSEAKDRLARELEQLAARELQAWEQLTVTLIPGLIAEHLDWAANLLRLPTIAAAQVHERIAKERAAIVDEIARIDAEPDYVERELRLNECDIHIAELDRVIEPLRASVAEFEGEPLFGALIDVGYDTPDYSYKWYQLSYYNHWKHGDEIVERQGAPRGLKTFAEVRARYLDESEAARTLQAERAPWLGRRATIDALVVRRAQQATALETIEDRHWSQTRARVHDHLSELDFDDILKLLADYEPGLYAAKRVAGVAAKRRYLQALLDEWLEQPYRQLARRLDKAERGVIKYRRPKNYNQRFDGVAMQKKYGVRREAWDKRWRKVDVATTRILEFDRYDDYRVGEDLIWWHLMTNGDVKARFIPDVAHYYDNRASLAHDHDDARDLAVAALADEALTGASTDFAADDFS